MQASGPQAGHPSQPVSLRSAPLLKSGYFLLEGLNTCGTSYYLYYLFFHLHQDFGFGNRGNLTVMALNGFIYIFAAWSGGRFAQRYGYHRAVFIGLTTMICMLLCGSIWDTIPGQLAVMSVWTVGMCFTWPSLEALVSHDATPAELPRLIGIYNMVWAGCGAVTFFMGGLLFEWLGKRSLFLLPAALHSLQLLLLWRLVRLAREATAQTELYRKSGVSPEIVEPDATRVSRLTARAFLRMAWLSNPFAYIAINTIIAVTPEIARHLDLSPTAAGFVCSTWFFIRLLTFLLLWQWTAWHYHFGYLLAAFIGLIGSFTAVLLAPKLWLLVLAQILFGVCVGLIYYSSLYYSMAIGETKGEHGGIHEAAIGIGIFMGPAVGATALRLAPEVPNGGAWAVSGLLTLGLALLLATKRKNKMDLPR